MTVTLATTLGACGSGDSGHEIAAGGDAPADLAAAERIRDHLAESWDEPEPIDFAALPPDDRARFTGLEDNLADVYPSVEEVDVTSGVVTMRTGLEAGEEEAAATAELICTTIYASGAKIAPKGHTVEAEDGTTLAACARDSLPL